MITPATFTNITNLVGQYLVDLLILYNRDSLAGVVGATPYIADEIRQGLFQDNPVKHRISILIYPGDPEDLREEARRADTHKNVDETLEITEAEIGGGTSEWIRFTVDVKVYLNSTHELRDDSRQIGTWVFSRIKEAIRENQTLDITDEFGEHAYHMERTKTNKFEGGGPGGFNWNGQLWVSVLIDSPSNP